MKKISLFVCSLALVLISASANAQWVQTSGPAEATINCIVKSGTNIFAGTDIGVFLSPDTGATWTAVNNGLTTTVIYSLAASGGNIFAGTYNQGVFLSTNNGASWTPLDTSVNTPDSVFNAFDSIFMASPIYSLAVIGGTVFAGSLNGGVFLSSDNGSIWTQVDSGSGLTVPSVLTFAVMGTNLFAGTNGGGVYVSNNNGATWTQVNNGLPTYNIFVLAVTGDTIFLSTNDGVFVSFDTGAVWSPAFLGLGASDVVYSLAALGPNIFAGTEGGGVYLSRNTGATWTTANEGLSTTYISTLAVCGTNFFAGTDGYNIWKRSVSDILGVEDISVDNSFSISPNPATNQLTIHASSLHSDKPVNVFITDVLGQTVSQSSIFNLQSSINISSLPAGIYFLQMKWEGGSEVKKFVKE